MKQLFGINAALVYIGVFVFECAAVALGAGLVAPRSPILTSMGFDEVILTFVIVVLGGIGSVGGTMPASIVLPRSHGPSVCGTIHAVATRSETASTPR